MRHLLGIVVLLLLTGCASNGFRTSLKAVADPEVRPGKDAKYAFLPEPDMRIEKRLLYERATRYLAASGFHMTQPDEAEFLIRVVITTGYSTTLDLETSLRPRVTARPDEGLTTFVFKVYRRRDILNAEWKSVWEASMLADAKEFRACEGSVFKGVFARMGESSDTRVVFLKDG